MSASSQCPVHGVACSTAYRRLKCRCEACVAWKGVRNAKYRAGNKEAIAAQNREYYAENRGAIAARRAKYRAENRARTDGELAAAQDAACPKLCTGCYQTKPRAGWYAKRQNADGLMRRCAACNRARVAARHARKLAAAPAGCENEPFTVLHEAARLWSERTGETWHVDHIVPLAREGPHCFANLQLMSEGENCRKNDRLEVECAELGIELNPVQVGAVYFVLDGEAARCRVLTDAEAFGLDL